MKRKSILILLLCMLPCLNAWAAEFGDIDIHGFISQGALMTDHNNYLADTEDGTLEFNEMAINFGTWAAPGLRVGMQFFARDLGDVGNDEVIVDWAYADYQWKQWLGIRVGKVKISHGLYSEMRDIDMARTAILLPSSLYDENARDAQVALKGGGVYGLVPMSSLGSVNYLFQYGVTELSTDGGIARFVTSATSAFADIAIDSFDVDKMYNCGLIWNTPLPGLRIGGTNLYTEMDIEAHLADNLAGRPDFTTMPPTFPVYVAGTRVLTETELNRLIVASAEYTLGNLVLAGEYCWFRNNQNMTIFSGPRAPADFAMKTNRDSIGYYGSAAYRFTDWLELGCYYSEFYADKDDKDGKTFSPDYRAWLKDLALSARFDLTPNWILKLEGHGFNGVALLNRLDNLDDAGNPDWKENWYLYACKLNYTF